MSSAPPTWNDWLTDSMFRVRVSRSAADKLRALPPEQQVRIRAMIEEIAELAALSEIRLAMPTVSLMRPLLQLRIARVTVRYELHEDTRTLAVEHVLVPDDEDPPLGQVG